MANFSATIEKNKDTIVKVLFVLVAVPVLLFLGWIIFSIFDIFASIIVFLVVALVVVGAGLIAWSFLEEKLQEKALQDEEKSKTIEGEATPVAAKEADAPTVSDKEPDSANS